MRYLALCCDYDGTLAHHGALDEPTIAALERLKKSGRRLVMVTGRELDELQTVCQRLDLFDRVVAENGALLYRPDTHEEKRLGERPPDAFVATLKAKKVERISVGRVIVATWEPHENTVLETIRDMGLELQVIFNKGAVMVLPTGVNKASGLRVALNELNLSEHNAVGIGDAENDHAFLSICECGVAVANALPSLKERADIVTQRDHGAGVTELIDEMLASDLQNRETKLVRHHVLLGVSAADEAIRLSPTGVSTLVVGTAHDDKSTIAAGLIERLCENGYNFCIVAPAGGYDAMESAVVVGGAQHPPTLDECVQLLMKPATNVVIDVLAMPLNERPRFFVSLLARIRDVRQRTGRPHVLIVDEAHRVLPAAWLPEGDLPQHLDGVLMLSGRPQDVAPSIVRALKSVIIVGNESQASLNEFAAIHQRAVTAPSQQLEPGHALLWDLSDRAPVRVKLEPPNRVGSFPT